MLTTVVIAMGSSLFLMVYSYVLYPGLLWIIPNKKRNLLNQPQECSVAVVIAAYNEEKVIGTKIQSVLKHIPEAVHLDIYVGSDGSTDKTNKIVEEYAMQYSNVHLVTFAGRSGKAKIVNDLVKERKQDILILTDANVLFTERTIQELLYPFSETQVGMTCANIIKRPKSDNAVEQIESHYIQRENNIKLKESLIWNIVMGAEGGCYAIRKSSFNPIPKNFFMDDFFMSMNVLEQNQQIRFQEHAICLEDVPDDLHEEFKRKVRISIGNYQNLFRFWRLLFRFNSISFALISHKVLRWFCPFFILILLLGSFYLFIQIPQWSVYFYLNICVFVVPFLVPDHRFLKPINYMKHFLSMNFALLIGFIKYLKGVQSSVWTPTKRT